MFTFPMFFRTDKRNGLIEKGALHVLVCEECGDVVAERLAERHLQTMHPAEAIEDDAPPFSSLAFRLRLAATVNPDVADLLREAARAIDPGPVHEPGDDNPEGL